MKSIEVVILRWETVANDHPSCRQVLHKERMKEKLDLPLKKSALDKKKKRSAGEEHLQMWSFHADLCIAKADTALPSAADTKFPKCRSMVF